MYMYIYTYLLTRDKHFYTKYFDVRKEPYTTQTRQGLKAFYRILPYYIYIYIG